MTDLAETIGDRIRRVRGELSQDAFAAKLDVAKDTVGKYERNQNVPGGDVLARIREKFGVDINWLLTGQGTEVRILVGESTVRERLLPQNGFGVPPVHPDEEFGATIADGVSRVYREENARISPADLWRISARIFSDAMAFESADQRPGFVAGALAALRRDLRKPIDQTGTGKRLA